MDTLREGPQAEVSFNYLGQLDQALRPDGPWIPASENTGYCRSQQGLRRHVIEINASVINKQLTTNWTWSENLHRPETIERLAGAYLDCLRRLATLSRLRMHRDPTPADFPLAKLDSKQLRSVLKAVQSAAGIR